MSKITFHCKIQGLTPYIMHNGRQADPFYKYTILLKELTSKRNKTDADLREIAKVEWIGSLYIKDGKIAIPSYVMQANLIKGCKSLKKGKSAGAGLIVENDATLIFPDQSLPIESIYEKEEYQFYMSVVMRGIRIMRMRPIFPEWGAEFDISFYDDLFKQSELDQVLRVAGDMIGLGDWRPEKYGKYGRYEVV